MKKIAIHTLGCKLNQVDSAAIAEAFEDAGYEVVPFSDAADVYIVNTCTVTGDTDSQSRQTLRRAIREKTARPHVTVIATGCYAQASPHSIASMVEGVDIIAGNTQKEHLVELVRNLQQAPHIATGEMLSLDTYSPRLMRSSGERTRAFLRIQEGCDNHCAYCIIPRVRGRSRSASRDSVLAQARAFAATGFPEIVITGIHIGRYGLDLPGAASFPALLTDIAAIDGVSRIRLSSIDPGEFTPELFDTLAALSSVICPYFHISLQSGDDEILARMGRDYTAAHFTGLIARIRSVFPTAGIGADVIVGFPGESDAAFENTRKVVAEAKIPFLHVFRYSRRPGTPAADMSGQVSDDKKKSRSHTLLALKNAINRDFRTAAQGTVAEVLFETRNKSNGLLTGLTPNYIRVFADAPDSLRRTVAPVAIEAVFSSGVRGSLISS